MLDSKLASRIYRQYTLMCEQFDDNTEYDKIVDMEYRGIPNLKDKAYYVEHIDTTGRDIIQQAVNIYSTQKPKWNVLPRGLGDVDTAKEFEKVIEWYMYKAAQMGRKRFHTEALMNACKYNKVCAQLEWTDDYNFCVKIYHPNTVVYEYGAKLQWVCVVNNVTASSVIEHWNDYAKPNWLEKLTKGDTIGSALRQLQELADDDPEQRVMYVDYTDEKKRYTYFYPVSGTEVDDCFGLDDEGKPKSDVVIIQDKANELGFINWAIAEGEGDALLAPLYKGNYYNNINDLETIKATQLFRRAFFPMFMKHGRKGEPVDVDFSGDEVVIETPEGSQLTQTVPPPLDSGFNELSAQMQNKMVNSIGISSTASLQVSNVQHSTLQDQIKLRLAQLEPYKRVTEQAFVQIAYLMFKWAKKKDKVLKGSVLYSSKGKDKDFVFGSEVLISSDDINLDSLYISCEIMPNNSNDRLQVTNQIAMLVQSDVPIPMSEYIEMLGVGDPDILQERSEQEKLRKTVLAASLTDIMNEPVMKMQKEMATFQAQLQQQMQQLQMMQQQQAMQGQVPPPNQMQGQVAPQQGMPLPSDGTTQGIGMDAGMGGMPPQEANAEITQNMRG